MTAHMVAHSQYQHAIAPDTITTCWKFSTLIRHPTNATYLDTRSFGSLNGLRALSIGAVLWEHTTSDVAGWPGLRRGFLGVHFFFIISGFLIVTLLPLEAAAREHCATYTRDGS
jgi:hypothetical protein